MLLGQRPKLLEPNSLDRGKSVGSSSVPAL
jgi:hypothetical protein